MGGAGPVSGARVDPPVPVMARLRYPLDRFDVVGHCNCPDRSGRGKATKPSVVLEQRDFRDKADAAASVSTYLLSVNCFVAVTAVLLFGW